VPRRQRVHSNLLWAELAGHAPSHLKDGRLAGVVRHPCVVLEEDLAVRYLSSTTPPKYPVRDRP
jgi:hypothetical protein